MATVIGTRHIRQDGKEKVTGAGRYTADMNLTGMLHVLSQLGYPANQAQAE